MDKYYITKYDDRLGGYYFEVYNENLKCVNIVRGSKNAKGLERIIRKRDLSKDKELLLFDTEDIGKGFVKLIDKE